MEISKSRRGIHTLLSVAMLIGFTLIGAALVLVIVSEYGKIATNSSSCAVSDVHLYRTGPQLAYLTASLHNLGSVPIHQVSIVFINAGSEFVEITNQETNLIPGQNLEIMTSFSARPDSLDKENLIVASAIFEDGSKADCIM